MTYQQACEQFAHYLQLTPAGCLSAVYSGNELLIASLNALAQFGI